MSCDSSDSSIRNLVKRMRNEDPDQFQTLVRMHLSFVLDLTLSDTESEGTPDKPKSRPLKWSIAPFTKRIKNLTKEIVKEGETCTPLTKNMLTQANKLITFLSQEENIVQEGLFRRSGKLTRQQELKASLVKNDPVDLSCYSVHDIATVLKGMLAELPEPLLTETYYPAYSQIAELCCGSPTTGLSPPVKARILRSLQLLCLLLPRENRWLLKNLLSLLHSTAGHEDSNRMSPQNLATLFTPHLLCSRKLSAEGFHSTAQTLSCVVVFMINESEEIFGIPEVLATDIHAYWENKEKNTFLERSISEAKTVFSFTDRALSLKEDAVNPTETALAQLYAHIQGLPDSSHKKRLIKQFNKENGNGTPRTKSLGVTIKKNIFSKNSKTKGLPDFSRLKNDSLPPPNNILSPKAKIARTPLATKLRLNLAGGCSDGKKSSSSSLDMPATENSDSLSMSESSHAESSEEADQLESFPNGPGGHDHAKEPKTGGRPKRIKSLPTFRQFGLDGQRTFLGPMPVGNSREGRQPSIGYDGGSPIQGVGCRLKRARTLQEKQSDLDTLTGYQLWESRKRERDEREEDGDVGAGGRRGGPVDVAIPGLPVQPECPDDVAGRSELLVKNGGLRPVYFRRRHWGKVIRLATVHFRWRLTDVAAKFRIPAQEIEGSFARRNIERR